jgi:hypothetical protein
MTQSTTPAEAGQANPDLPRLIARCSKAQAVERLERLSRRGKLPGFRAPARDGEFSVSAFGHPFDRVLVARGSDTAEGTVLAFRLRWSLPLPTAFGALIALTIWPGVWLTDSMLSTYFDGYAAWTERGWMGTWTWYLPLCAPLPWALRSMLRRSAATSREAALRTIETIARELGGERG